MIAPWMAWPLPKDLAAARRRHREGEALTAIVEVLATLELPSRRRVLAVAGILVGDPFIEGGHLWP